MNRIRNLILPGVCAFALGWSLIFLYGYATETGEGDTESEKTSVPRFGHASTEGPSSRRGASASMDFADFYQYVQNIRSTKESEDCFGRIMEDTTLSSMEKTARMGMLLSKWGELAPRQAIRKVLEERDIWKMTPQGTPSLWLICIFTGWASKDPEAAADFFMESDDPLVRKNLHVPVFLVQKWAEHSPRDAWKWLTEQDKDSFLDYDQGKQFVIHEIMDHDLDGIPDFIAGLSEQDAERYAPQLWRSWFREHPDSPEIMDSLPEEYKYEALMGSIWGKTKGDLDALTREISGYSREEQQKILYEFAPSLIFGDKARKEHVINWLMENAPGALLQRSVQNSLRGWFVENRKDANEVLDKLPDGEEKKALMEAYNSAPIMVYY